MEGVSRAWSASSVRVTSELTAPTSLNDTYGDSAQVGPHRTRLFTSLHPRFNGKPCSGGITHNPLQPRFKSTAPVLLWGCRRSECIRLRCERILTGCCVLVFLRWFCWGWTSCRRWSAGCRRGSGRRWEQVSTSIYSITNYTDSIQFKYVK